MQFSESWLRQFVNPSITTQELEHLMGAKVFLQLWVKVRSGWADDEARVRSFGYE